MKVSAEFKDGELSLVLVCETDAERSMVGTLVDLPREHFNIDQRLLTAKLKSDSHWTYKKVDSLRLTVHKEPA